MNTDFSACCTNKPEKKQIEKKLPTLKKEKQEKRQRSGSGDYPFNIIDDNEIYENPAKKPAYNYIYNQVFNKHNGPNTDPNWSEPQDEDEVVCTPDLLSLMQEEEEPPMKELEPPAPPPSIQTLPTQPSAQSYIRVKVFANEKEMQTQQTFISHNMQHHMNYQIRSPISQLRPMNHQVPPLISSRPHIIFPQRAFLNNIPPPRLAPIRQLLTINQPVRMQLPTGGPHPLKQEWFDKAAQQAASINGKLTAKLVELSQEQRAAITVEQMANVHNKLQELLSTSVNSLIQVRKNLRADFLNDLNKMKFPNGQPQQQNVMYVNNMNNFNTHFQQSQQRMPYPRPAVSTTSILQSSLEKPRLKVKSVSELLNVPAECITIPDEENVKTPTPNRPIPLIHGPGPSTNGQIPIVNIFNENIEFSNLMPQIKPKETEPVNDETDFFIKQALIESKFEYTMGENLKVRVNGVPEQEVKKMLSVRICLETNFGTGTPKSNPKKSYKALEFDHIKVSNLSIGDCENKSVPNDEIEQISRYTEAAPKSNPILQSDTDNSNDSGTLQEDNELDVAEDSEKSNSKNESKNEEYTTDQITTDSGIEIDGK